MDLDPHVKKQIFLKKSEDYWLNKTTAFEKLKNFYYSKKSQYISF